MPKPITLEMLHAMDLSQRKVLHQNASARDTPAAREVLALLAQDDLMGAPKPAPRATARKTTAVRKPRATPAKPLATAASNPRSPSTGVRLRTIRLAPDRACWRSRVGPIAI